MGWLGWWFDIGVRWRLPKIAVRTDDLGDGEYDYWLHAECGTTVGEMSATVLPAKGNVYVRHIRVEERWQGQRYGTAAVYWLAKRYGLPLVPVQEVDKGPLFWAAMRKWSGISMRVRQPISLTDFRAISGTLGT